MSDTGLGDDPFLRFAEMLMRSDLENLQNKIPASASMNFTERRKILHEKFMEDLRKKEAASAAAAATAESGCACGEKTVSSNAIDRFLHALKEDAAKKDAAAAAAESGCACGENTVSNNAIDRFLHELKEKQESRKNGVGRSYNPLKKAEGSQPLTLEMREKFAQMPHFKENASQQ